MKKWMLILSLTVGLPMARAEMFAIVAEATCPNGQLEAMAEISDRYFTPRPDSAKVRFLFMGGHAGDLFTFRASLEARTDADLPYLREYVAQRPGFDYE